MIEISTEIGKDFFVCLFIKETISFLGDLRSQELKLLSFPYHGACFISIRKMKCNLCQLSFATFNELNPLRTG